MVGGRGIPGSPIEYTGTDALTSITRARGQASHSSQNNFETNMSNTNEHPQVLTLKEAAAYLRVSKAHLANVINGKVPGVLPVRSFRVGRRVLIKREWIDEWLETSRREAVR